MKPSQTAYTVMEETNREQFNKNPAPTQIYVVYQENLQLYVEEIVLC